MPDCQPAAGLESAEVWTVEASPDTHVRDVAYAEIGSRPVAVATVGTTIGTWDLASGERLTPASDTGPEPKTASATLIHVAVTHCAGNPVAVTGDTSGRVQLWDLRGGRLGEPLTRFGSRVQAVAATRGAGAGLALAAQGAGATSNYYSVPVCDEAVDVWDVATGEHVRRLFHGGYTDSIAVGEHEGRALAVVSAQFAASPLIDPLDSQSRVFVWDLETGEQIGAPLEAAREDDLIGSVAVGSVAGRAVVVGVSGGGLCVWEPGHVRPTAHIPNTGTVACVAWGRFGGRPVVLVGGGPQRPDLGGRAWLRIWDPRDWRLLGELEPGYGVLAKFAPAADGRVILPWVKSVKVLRYEEASASR